MKKQIYMVALVLIFGSLIIWSFKSKDKQMQKLTIQAGFRYVEDFEMIGVLGGQGAISSRWVQDKTKKTTTISFHTDEATMDLIIAKLRADLKNYSFRKSKDGKVVRLAWMVEKTKNELFLRLIYPKVNANKDDRC